MKRSTAVVALSLAVGALAQNGIPTGISNACTTYLTGLNTNQVINDCLTALIDSTSDFDPSTNGASTSASTSVQNALSTICSTSFNKCPQADIRQMLANFYTNCGSDMLGTNGDGSNGNKDVVAIYDVLYLITPLKGAICTKDGNQYCVNVIASDNSPSNTTSGSSSVAADASSSDAPAPSGSDSSDAAASSSASSASSAPASGSGSASQSSSATSAAASPSQSTHARRSHVDPSVLYRRADNSTDQQTLDTVSPEAAQYNTLGLPYLFITANLTQEKLCTPCTAEVVGQYIQFETVTPYALGIANSPMLSGQVALWNKIKDCPNNFASNLLNNATGSTTSSGGAVSSVKFGAVQVAGAVVAALVGGVMLF